MSKYTPGKWEQRKRQHNYYSIYAPGRTFALIDVFGENVAEAEANAHLVAAAPLLLAACKWAREALRDLSEHPAFADDAPEFNEDGIAYYAAEVIKAAIAAAEGGEL